LGSLILKRANTSRLFGQWSDDDYDVLIGGIFKVPIGSAERPSEHNGEIRQAAWLRADAQGAGQKARRSTPRSSAPSVHRSP